MLSFLQKASQVCETLLEENLRRNRRKGEEKEEGDVGDDGTVFGRKSGWVDVYSSASSNRKEESKSSGNSTPLARPWDAILQDRQVVDVVFNPSPSKPHLLMTVHAPTTSQPAANQPSFLQGRTVVALWDSALLSVGRAMGPSKVGHEGVF